MDTKLLGYFTNFYFHSQLKVPHFYDKDVSEQSEWLTTLSGLGHDKMCRAATRSKNAGCANIKYNRYFH